MKNLENNLIISTIVFFLFLVFCIPFLLLSTLDYIYYDPQPSLGGAYELYGDRSIIQTIYARDNLLKGVGMSIKNPNQLDKNKIFLKVFDSKNDLLRTSVLNGSNIPDGVFTKFEFDPIDNAKGKEFQIELTSPDSKEGEIFAIFLTKEDQSGFGKLYINNNETNENIALVSFYKPESRLYLFGYVYNNFIAKFLKDGVFAMFYIAVILSGLIYLMINIKKDGK